MLLLGTICSALLFGALLEEFTPARLIQVIQGSAVATIALNLVSLWKQEGRRPPRGVVPARPPTFRESWGSFAEGPQALRRLAAVGLGTMAFGMQDVLLEPYGGQVLQLSVSSTTRLTATLALGGLLGFGLASRVLGRGADPIRIARQGAMAGVPAFAAVIAAAPLQSPMLFGLGVLLIGFGGGLFSHGTLTATMNLAPREQTGLALGAWGAVQATGAGVAVALGGLIRDAAAGVAAQGAVAAGATAPAGGYMLVYSIEIALLLATLVASAPLQRPMRVRTAAA
jgi:MFS transporter, BCD family, chlorophyll transporter